MNSLVQNAPYFSSPSLYPLSNMKLIFFKTEILLVFSLVFKHYLYIAMIVNFENALIIWIIHRIYR